MAKYFNSVTGRFEDDGLDITQPGSFTLPTGRLASPDGSQDVQIPSEGFAAQDAFERKNSKQIELGMMQNPERYPFSSLGDIASLLNGLTPGPTAEAEPTPTLFDKPKAKRFEPRQDSNRSPAIEPQVPQQELNPEVKKYLMEKYKISDDLGTEAYRDAQRATSKNTFNANLAEAANRIGSAIGGVTADNSFYDKLRSQAGQGEKSIVDARKFETDTRNEKLQIDKLNREQDVSSDESKLAQSLAKQMVPGMDFSKLSASQINEKIPSLQKVYELKVKQQENALNRETQRMFKASMMNEKLDAKNSKLKASMNEIEDRRQVINGNLKTLKDMIDANGTYEMFGSHNQDMERLVETIATDMAKLQDPSSVARPSEVEAVKKNLVQAGFKNANGTAQDILKNFEREVNVRADSAYKIRGLEAPTGRPQAMESGAKRDQDSEAIDWAQANPSDPRAKKILKMHGM